MATGIDAKIASLLFDHAEAMTLPQTTGFAYPDVVFVPTNEQPYIRLSFLPNTPNTLAIGAGYIQHIGLFQLSIMWPTGSGVIDSLETADAIQQEFDKGTRLIGSSILVNVISRPSIGGQIIDGDRTMTPVTVEYQSFNT